MARTSQFPEQVFTSLSPQQLVELDAVAGHDGRSRSESIRRAVAAYVTRYRQQHPDVVVVSAGGSGEVAA